MINAPHTVIETVPGAVTVPDTARPHHGFALLGDVRVVFAFCILVGLIPIWSVPWVPTIDGPVHVYIVYLLDKLAQPGTTSFHRVFEYNPNIEPNFTVYGVIWLFSRFLPYLVAEKLFVSLYWVTFALSSLYAMSFFGRRAAVLGLLLLPFAFGYFFHFGFYNFVFSQALFLLACGYALRHLERLRLRSLLVLGALMLALTVTHLVGIAMFLFFLAASRLGIALRDLWTPGAPRDVRTVAGAFVFDGLKIVLAALPSLAIVIDFALRRVVTDETTATVLTSMEKAFYVASISPIFSIDKRELIVLLPYVALVWLSIALLAFAMLRNRAALISGLPVLLPAALLAGILAVGTLGFAGFDALPRLMPFLFFTGIIALGLVPPARWRHIATVVVVAGGLTLTSFFHVGFYRQINEMYDGFARARPAPAPGTAIVAVNVADQQRSIGGGETGWRMDVTEHFRDRYVREKGVVMANIELLSPRIYGYFPVQYRATATLDEKLMKPEFRGHRALLAEFRRGTGVPVAEVSFWPSIPRSQWAAWGYPEGQRVLIDELDAEWRRLPAKGPLSSEIYVRR